MKWCEKLKYEIILLAWYKKTYWFDVNDKSLVYGCALRLCI